MITRRHLLYGTGLAGLALALGACSGSAEELRGTTAVLTLPLEGTPHVADAATASARIAWQLMVADPQVTATNRAIAPGSLAVTLAMLAEGAAGTSLQSLDEVFGLTGDERSAAVGALRQALADYEDLPKSVDADDPPETPVVHQANRAVIIDDAKVNQDFLDRLASYYDTAAARLPLDGAQADLDAWARKNTAGLVKKSAIVVTPELRLITQDALLFAAAWRQRFTNANAPLSFTTGDGTSGDIDALADTFMVAHAEGDGWEAVRLPYDDNLAMDVVLPAAGTHPADLDFDTLDASVTALNEAAARPVDLVMPPSDIMAKWDLLPPLGDLGVDLSDLGGIFPGAYVGVVAQQVRLTVTARGTVGAALTETGVPTGAQPPPEEPVELIVDRPFVMRVLDTRTGWPLFLAIVNDPAVRSD
ncbi:MAG: serpin family protein [Arachnia sp.]